VGIREFTSFHEFKRPKFGSSTHKDHLANNLGFGKLLALIQRESKEGCFNMSERRQGRNLAHEIGMCRMAMVVNAVHRQMEGDPQFAQDFATLGNPDEQRAQLTYFWWVALGGKALRNMDSALTCKFGPKQSNDDSLEHWLAMFRTAALPILGQELTQAWAKQAVRLIPAPETAKNEAAQLAMAS
jgi:hypothetical protein